MHLINDIFDQGHRLGSIKASPLVSVVREELGAEVLGAEEELGAEEVSITVDVATF